MVEVKSNILYINSEELLPQFKNCDTTKVNFARLTRECLERARDADMVVFVEDRKHENHRDSVILKMKIPEELNK